MTVHFIGAGPGAADLITVRGRDGVETITHSDASIAATGLANLSEAAALAAAGPGGSLLGPRVVLGPATCALAKTGGAS